MSDERLPLVTRLYHWLDPMAAARRQIACIEREVQRLSRTIVAEHRRTLRAAVDRSNLPDARLRG